MKSSFAILILSMALFLVSSTARAAINFTNNGTTVEVDNTIDRLNLQVTNVMTVFNNSNNNNNDNTAAIFEIRRIETTTTSGAPPDASSTTASSPSSSNSSSTSTSTSGTTTEYLYRLLAIVEFTDANNNSFDASDDVLQTYRPQSWSPFVQGTGANPNMITFQADTTSDQSMEVTGLIDEELDLENPVQFYIQKFNYTNLYQDPNSKIAFQVEVGANQMTTLANGTTVEVPIPMSSNDILAKFGAFSSTSTQQSNVTVPIVQSDFTNSTDATTNAPSYSGYFTFDTLDHTLAFQQLVFMNNTIAPAPPTTGTTAAVPTGLTSGPSTAIPPSSNPMSSTQPTQTQGSSPNVITPSVQEGDASHLKVSTVWFAAAFLLLSFVSCNNIHNR